MNAKIEADPQKSVAFFLKFSLSHRSQLNQLRQGGLILAEGSRTWRNLLEHHILGGAMSQTFCKLLMLSAEQTNEIVNEYLVHDRDKRQQRESKTFQQIYREEGAKSQRFTRATGTDFSDFDTWDISEYVLRYVDSSMGQNSDGYAVIVPWKERVGRFLITKGAENDAGRIKYEGRGTYEELARIMEVIESTLFDRVIKINPNLLGSYPSPQDLTALIKDSLVSKINSI